MRQRFEEDFNELNLIYEAFAKKASGQKDHVQGAHSYNKGFMQNGNTNRYAANAMAGPVPVSDEEKESSPLQDKIEDLIDEAESNGQDYAVHQLTSLKAWVEERS